MRRLLAPLSLAALLASSASARVTLQSILTVEETPDGPAFAGVALNTGDQTAEDCVVTLVTPFGESLVRPVGHLDPGVSNAWSLAYSHPAGARRGTFAAVVRTRYADPNGFPLHALQVFPYALGDAADARSPARVTISAPTRDIEGTALAHAEALRETAPLDGSARCSVELIAAASLQRPATLQLLFPGSLAGSWGEPRAQGDGEGGPVVWTNALSLALSPPYPASVPFTVTNLSALAGSRISIAALLASDTADGVSTCAATTFQFPIGATPPEFLPLVAGPSMRRPLPPAVPVAALLLFLGFELFGGRRRLPALPAWFDEAAALAFALLLLAYELRLDLVLSPTLCLGGDTPAHHYLFSHLRESLAHGRIVSWAPGWWCGFPMFQYYFPLPYLAMVVLDLALPSTIAFKLALVLGLFLTPVCAYAAARLLRLPRPAPALLVLANLPLLLDTTHVMWGVNLTSTLAGMISNSWSFAFFPLALASVVRDTLDGRPRPRTILLLLAVLLSHFFTSIVLCLLLLAALPALLAWRAKSESPKVRESESPPPGPSDSRTFGPSDSRTLGPLAAFLIDGLAAVLLMLWWLLPLVATRPYSVDYGDPWKIHLWGNLPIFAQIVLIVTPVLLVFAVRRCRRAAPDDGTRALLLAGLLAVLQIAIALVLFFFGYRLSKVFVNCRLWPFWLHGLLVLSALAAALWLHRSRHPRLGALAYALLVVTYLWNPPNQARGYSEWDFGGVEARSGAPVYRDLVERLRGTPGRFSCDLHPDNVRFGSTRAFEALPALDGKPIVEGGIVNSALGSLAAYSVQGEVSDAPAGWPLRVRPRSMDIPTGLRHLELFGVRHFLARSSYVQAGLDADPAWSLVHDYGKWRLYENPSVDGSLVHAYPDGLPVVVTNDFQGAIIAWANDPSLASTPQVVLPTPPVVLSAPSAVPSPSATALPASPVAHPRPVTRCEQGFNRLSFTTPYVGAPHLVAVSAFPNWKVAHGADRLEYATPGFMVVWPTENEVELVFAPTRADWIGRLFLLPGAVLLLFPARVSRLFTRRIPRGTPRARGQ